jgi:lipopolysaccharide transport system ATP-binding protein
MGEIIAFAELEGFIDEPLRTYSSGMKARLAFSTAAQVDADIMLVDEVLAVGDLAFQRRCVARMRALRDGGVTIVLVSHDLDLVRLLCDDALWLEDGRVLAVGPADRVVGAYTASASGGRARGVARENDRPCTPGTGVRIARVHLLDGRGHEADVLCSGDPLTVAIDIERVTREPVNVSVHVRPARGAVVLDTSAVVQGPCARLEIERLDLAPGAYAVDVRVFSEDWLALLDGAAPAPLSVWGRGSTDSVLLPPLVWRTAPDR